MCTERTKCPTPPCCTKKYSAEWARVTWWTLSKQSSALREHTARCDKRSNTTCDTQSYQSTVIFVFVQIFVYFVFGYFSFFCVFVCQRPMTRDQTEVLTLNLITSLPGFVKRKLQDIVNTVWRKENS